MQLCRNAISGVRYARNQIGLEIIKIIEERRIAIMQIELTGENIGILKEILASHLTELRMEIANTDRKEFREFLRTRIDFIEQFVQSLGRESTPKGKETSNKPLTSSLER